MHLLKNNNNRHTDMDTKNENNDIYNKRDIP
jgi:hypothetical protein